MQDFLPLANDGAVASLSFGLLENLILQKCLSRNANFEA